MSAEGLRVAVLADIHGNLPALRRCSATSKPPEWTRSS